MSDDSSDISAKAAAGGTSTESVDEFVRLLGQNQRRLFLYLCSLLPNQEDADDLMQETNMVLWREFHNFELGTNFTAWACRVAFNQVRAWRKRRQRDRLVFSEAFLSAISDELTDQATQLEERSLALASCLQRLPAHHRELIEQRYGAGDGIETLAERLQKKSDAIYRMLSRIRHTLHDCVSRSVAEEVN